MSHISVCCLKIYRPYLVFLVPVYIIYYQKCSNDTDKMLLFTLFKKYYTLGSLSLKHHSDSEEWHLVFDRSGIQTTQYLFNKNVSFSLLCPPKCTVIKHLEKNKVQRKELGLWSWANSSFST